MPTKEELERETKTQEQTIAAQAATIQSQAQTIKLLSAQADAAPALADAASSLAAQLKAAEDAIKGLESSVASYQTSTKSYQEHIAKLEAKLSAAPAPAPQAAQAPAEEPLGSIDAGKGFIAVASTSFLDQRWVPPTAGANRSALAIDFKGPHARTLATRGHRETPQELPDGTLRVVCPHTPFAGKLKDDAERWLREQEDGHLTTVTTAPLQSTGLVTADATRAQGAGLAVVEGQAAVAALHTTGASIRVTATRKNGRIVALHLHAG